MQTELVLLTVAKALEGVLMGIELLHWLAQDIQATFGHGVDIDLW